MLQCLITVSLQMDGTCGMHIKKNSCRNLLGKPVGKRHVESPIRRCEDNINPYPTAFPYGNGMVLHFYQQQESSTTKTVHRVINKGLKTYV